MYCKIVTTSVTGKTTLPSRASGVSGGTIDLAFAFIGFASGVLDVSGVEAGATRPGRLREGR